MRMYTKAGRSRWPYVIGGAVVVVAVAGGIVYSSTQPGGEPTAVASSEPSASATPAPSEDGSSGAGDGDEGVAPTGCLGGQDRNALMVSDAQKTASHTAFGAVEVATSFYRFYWQYPYATADQLDTVSSTVIGNDAPDSFKQLSASFDAVGDNPTGGKIAAGTPFHMSTTNGLWRVSEDSTPDRITVSLAAGYVINGALSPTEVGVGGFVMVWEDNAWHVESGISPDQDLLAAGGTRYTGGC
jgi:hypothetical protein